MAWKLCSGWDSEGRDIGWAESIAVELTVLWIAEQNLTDREILIHGDYTGVINSYKKGCSRNIPHNSSIQRITASLIPSNPLLHPYLYLPNPTWLIPFPTAIWDLPSVSLHTILSSLMSSNLFSYMYRVSLPSASASADALFLERRNHNTTSLLHSDYRIHCPHISLLHNNFLLPSPLHPHVIASNCITHWKAPFLLLPSHIIFPPKTIHHW